MASRVGRLRRRSEFLRVASKGRKVPQKGLVLQARTCDAADKHSDPDADLWLGITVSRKVGKAVARNRARRRLRSAAKDVLPRIAAVNHDYVLIGRQATLTRPYPDLLSDLETALRRLGTIRTGDGSRPAASGEHT